MSKHKILIVDDEVENLNLLRRTFIREYKVHTADNAQEALRLLDDNPDISLIISDQRMAGMTGTELFKEVVDKNIEAMKILLTAYTDVEALVDAINTGKVYKYVTKPWDPEEFKLTVKRALEVYELTQENKQLLKDLAQKNAELKKMKDYSEERVEEERLRISRELHDDICQSLASLNLSMEIILRMLKPGLEQSNIDTIKDNLLTMREQIKATSQRVRRISMDLRPAELDSLGFVPTIEQFINRFNKYDDTPNVQLNVTGNIVSLPQKLELAMFRLIQECLNNIKKHAYAKTVDITLLYNNDKLDITVQDDGKGFNLPDNLNILLQEGHLGLIGMQERVNQFNGDLKITSTLDKGTTVLVSVKSTGGTFE
jgi:signal transduction histidine kinase